MRPTSAISAPHLATLVMLTALSVLSLNMFLPSLAQVATDFGVSYGQVSLAVSGYFIVTGVLQLIMGPLSDRYGRRPILLAGLALFVAGSVGCALATDVWSFLGFRLVQAAVVSAMALSRAVVRDTSPPQEATARLGQIGLAMGIAPLLAPMVGGFVGDIMGWRAIFWLYAVLGAIMLMISWRDLGETNLHRSETFAAQFRTYPDLIASRRFWGYSLCLTFSVGGFYVFITGAALVLPTDFGLSPTMLGLTMGCITLGFMAGNVVAARVVSRMPVNRVILIGRLTNCVGTGFGLSLFLLGIHEIWVLFLAVIPVGFGNGMTVPGANVGVMSVRPKLAGSASGLSGALGVWGGAGLTSATTTLLDEQSGALALVAVLFVVSLFALASLLYVIRVDRLDPLPDSELPARR